MALAKIHQDSCFCPPYVNAFSIASHFTFGQTGLFSSRQEYHVNETMSSEVALVDNKKWHARTEDEVLAFWRTDSKEGLSSQEASNRLQKYGYNEMTVRTKPPWFLKFIDQFKDFMVLVLLAATLISAFLGEYADSVTILIIVVLNAVLGFVQEFRAERSLEMLQKLAAATAKVIRNGVLQQLPARELAPGDIMVIESGDKLAADGRIIEAQNIEADEAALTGESLTVRKVAAMQFEENTALGDRKNMIYAGTIITRGRGKAVVCATGMGTEVGHIAGMLDSTKQEATPLEKRLEHLGKLLVWSCLLICLIVVIVGIVKGESFFLMCMAGISLAVAAIPEGLPAIVTVALALGIQRMIKRNAIIRKLPAVETLGCTTVICSDKTGTLTQNAMTVRKLFTLRNVYDITGDGYGIKGELVLSGKEFSLQEDKALQQCILIGALCNNSILKCNNVGISGLWRGKDDGKWNIEGDPTEGALLVAAAKLGVWRSEVEKTYKRLVEIPFEAEKRRMSVIYEDKTSFMLYTKGAVDTILDICRYVHNGDKEQPLSAELRAKINAANEEMAGKSLRVLAFAYKRINAAEFRFEITEKLEKDMIFAGLIGMVDPPRPEAKRAIEICKEAGIKTVMITGDHPNTAIAIAKELHIFREDVHQSLSGQQLDKLSDDELKKMVNNVTVYARVSPIHKLRIVKALKSCGHVVAMTGDGVNDAPAVREASIGISMGKSGTDVTKEASAMILTDDNFATIVAAVEEGRCIYDNIRKFIRYLLACNLGEVLTMFIAIVVGLPLPLLPVQILWVNLITDGLPAIALGIDTHDPAVMHRPPRSSKESVFSRGLSRKILIRGIQIGASTVLIFALVFLVQDDLELARTMAFVTLVVSQLFHVFDCRSENVSAFEIGLAKNKFLIFTVFCSILMEIAVIYNPFLRDVFQTVSLTVYDWLLVIVISGWAFILNGLKYLLFGKTKKRILYSRT
jgi:Ca2+-transporting ATPase